MLTLLKKMHEMYILHSTTCQSVIDCAIYFFLNNEVKVIFSELASCHIYMNNDIMNNNIIIINSNVYCIHNIVSKTD